MKNIIIVIFMLFLITGCFNSDLENNENSEIKGNGRIYNIVNLYDRNNNLLAFQGIIPEGWTTYIESNWNVISSTVPGKEIVTLGSDDHTAKIVITSMQAFVDSDRNAEGENKDYYTTYLRFMNACNYSDYYTSHNYGDVKYIEDVEFNNSSKTINQLDSFRDMLIQGNKDFLKKINASQYGYSVNITPLDSTVCKRRYSIGSNIIETSTTVTGYKGVSKNILYTQTDKEWFIPLLIVFVAEDEESFNKYYDDYNFIVINSGFTTKFYAMNEYVASAIQNVYSAYYAEKSRAGLEAVNNFIDSNYSSTSSASTNEKVMEMWDDVIKEVDSYKLEDGSTLKTSIFNDTVAQNGNEIYIGDKAGVPLGFNILGKSY